MKAFPSLLLAAAPLAFGLLPPTDAWSQEIVRRVGRVTVRIDSSRAFPGGVLSVRVSSRGRLGAVWALLDGRRAPFYPIRGVLHALVPIPADAEPGPATLGIAIAARRGEQRIPTTVEISARQYPTRAVLLPDAARLALPQPHAMRDARRLLALVRTESKPSAPGVLQPPVEGAGSGFGELRRHAGLTEVESRIDAIGGERHRGIDYPVPAGTPVRAPGAGIVLFAGPLTLSGGTIVIDHGQGVVSVLQHLSREDVRAGDMVAVGAPVGRSGETGAASGPLLQWRVYLHGIAVDPRVLGPLLG